MTGDKLHPIYACLMHVASGLYVTCGNLIYHALIQRLGHHMKALIGHSRSRISHGQQALTRFHDFAAWVKNLRKDGGAVCMAHVGHFAVAIHTMWLGGHQQMRGIAGAFMHARHLQHNQACAAFGTRALVGQ